MQNPFRPLCRGLLVAIFCSTSWLPVWGAGNILMITTNNGWLTSLESARKGQIESWGFTVNTIWDGASQATFNTAFANNRAVYLSDEATASEVGYKLREATIGVFTEHPGLTDELGLCSSSATTTSSSTVNITNNTHYITSVFATGNLLLGSSWYSVIRMGGTTASGAQVLATVGGINSIVAVDTGATLANTYNSSNIAFGRRVQFPLPVSINDSSTFNANTFTMSQRMLNWAAGLDKALVGHWKVNETTGTSAADSSGLSTSGIVTGTATWVAGVLNNGFQFNGSTKIQVSGLFSNPKNLSVGAWANLTTADSTGSEIISLGDHFYLRLDEAGLVKAAAYNGSTWQTVTFSGTYAGTGWHHFAAVFDDDNNTFKLYVDGVLATSVASTSSISYAGLGSNTVIGRQGNAATTSDFTGIIDDVRVYNYAITVAEVAQLYGLLGQWKLNQTSGTSATDSTMFARNATLSGTAAWSSDCGGMGTFDFNGTSQYFTIASVADFQPTGMISICAWIKGDAWGAVGDVDTILRKGEASPNNYALEISDGKVEFLLNATEGVGIRGNTVLATGQWYFVAATWDGTTAKIYVNGVLDNSPGTAKAAPIPVDTRPLYIGGRSGADLFDGMIRDVRIYNRPMTAAELVEGAGLVGYWKFAEGTGTTAADSSGLTNTATLSGGAAWTSDCAGNNNALLTNGAGGIAQTAAPVEPPSVGTVAFWMRSTGSPAATARIMGLGPDWEIRQNSDGRVISDLSGDGDTTVGTTTPLTEVGRWYHFAATFDISTKAYAIYVDGKLELSGTNANAMSQQPADKISFGTRTGTTEYWNGALRDVRIYNRKLCPAEIQSLYGLVLYWKMDETNGSMASDSSGAGNNGTYTGGPTLGASAPNNLGAYFPSDGKCVVAPASGTLNALGLNNANFSVAFWVKPGTATGGWRPLLHKGSVDSERGPGLWLNPGNNRVHFRVGTTANWNEGADSVAAPPTGAWSHVACVKAGNNWQCYVDGVLDTQFTLSAGTIGNSGPLYVGDDPWYGGSNVYMDDVRIYSRALCPSDVLALKNGGNPFGGVKIIKWVEIQ